MEMKDLIGTNGVKRKGCFFGKKKPCKHCKIYSLVYTYDKPSKIISVHGCPFYDMAGGEKMKKKTKADKLYEELQTAGRKAYAQQMVAKAVERIIPKSIVLSRRKNRIKISFEVEV